MLTMSPTGSNRVFPSSLGMIAESLVEDQEQKLVSEEAKVFAGLAAATAQQATRIPVIDGLFGHLQQFRDLIDRQYLRELRRPHRFGKVVCHVLGRQVQAVLAGHLHLGLVRFATLKGERAPAPLFQGLARRQSGMECRTVFCLERRAEWKKARRRNWRWEQARNGERAPESDGKG